uniref:2-methoxy-6-polyprenyl-1,4-benzoquinol methylase, mitochondrial n=1 Tax=Candidatus Methanogaster sp. ANME-2c ERB4 TaxID=2759911 RepID=A0A7G9YGZ5_9EURY|nr:2-methoxy-6-polyprenyl-1,4-benzoquinol methylase, mitochondrial [Methanosarcinales archaeon ANME-2c ERB4]QNO47279.1 2-methoxy-6-polyprenyl-1,4-benzoquinol methylase, mitochondrial [Methanosarcinales archaeon ANME-2c ERB4]QNO48142.1 2-methoxy-6-polyprenyl-1,4-benzoquinol methylase, mitochondrial [Methanosarcinales archaeon ANME-2c ERB4]
MFDYVNEVKKTRDRYNRLALLYDLDDVLWLGSKQYSRKKLIKETNLPDSGLVLDLTTGTGRNAGLLARWVKNGAVIGIDISRNVLKVNRFRNDRYKNLQRVQGMVQQLPFTDETFDAVFCTCGMDTIDRPEIAFSEAVRVVKKNGTISLLHLKSDKGPLDVCNFLSRFYAWVWRAEGADLLPHVQQHKVEIPVYKNLHIAEAIIARKTG